MESGIEKECGALGGLFQLIMNDMKVSYPTWEDFVSKGAKLQSQLRTTIVVTGAFLDAFQKVADMATGTRGATKEIGTALTRMCLRHRSIESKLKVFTTALSESLITPLELKMEEWKKVASQLDKDHAKEYKKARADLKKKSSDTIKLQKKMKKGKDEVRGQLDSALQDVSVRYAVLEETEKRAVGRALIEERARYCTFVTMLKPVLDHEINLLGEVTHLQTIQEDLTNLTAEPNKLPPASEQVISDLKGSDFNFTYQTPPASPSTSMSRKSSISSNYQTGSVRHVPSLDSIRCAVDGAHIQDLQMPAGGGREPENGLLAPPHNIYMQHVERAGAMSASGKTTSAQDRLTLNLGPFNSDTWSNSRDSLHCSSGYNTQTTTPSCSEDTIHTHTVQRGPSLYVDFESISLHGDADSRSLHHHGNIQLDFDKSSTIPRNSDLSFQYRKFAQSKRPASTVSLLADTDLMGGSVSQLPSHTATIRRKPSSKPAYRRGTISGGVPIPICTPQVPLRALEGNSLSNENVFTVPPAGVVASLEHSKLCTSTQSLITLPPTSSALPYYQLVPGHMPIPVPVPTIPTMPAEVSNTRQQLQRQNPQPLQQLQKLQQHVRHQSQLDQHLMQGQVHNQDLRQSQVQNLGQNLNQDQVQNQQQNLNQQQKQRLFQQQHQVQLHLSTAQEEVSWSGHSSAQHQPLPRPGLDHDLDPPTASTGGGGAGGGDMLSLIRGVKLKGTITNDRSAPLLPASTNHK